MPLVLKVVILPYKEQFPTHRYLFLGYGNITTFNIQDKDSTMELILHQIFIKNN